jgi:outer membrane biosynthesis protein TonB
METKMLKINDVVANANGSFAPELIEIATGLQQMSATFAGFASTAAAQVFTHQDALDLDADDVIGFVTELANQRQVIRDNAEAALNIAAKSHVEPQPEPRPDPAPVEELTPEIEDPAPAEPATPEVETPVVEEPAPEDPVLE